jgi:DNA-binding Lrp family transcriptional regulator
MLQDNFIIINFQSAKQPEYKEKRGVGYIEFGEKNDYPNYLLDLYNKSSKHSAIIRGKVNYIIGNGWDGTNEQFIDSPNRYETLSELTRKVSIDIEIFGGAYLECIWSEFGGKLVEVNHIDYTRIRTNKDCTMFWYKSDWKNYREKPIEISAFNTNLRTGKQILYVKEYRPGLVTYSLPNYMAALNYIESDIEVSNHVLGNAQTGFSPSKLITLPNGEPSDEEKRNLTKRFEKSYTGSDGKKFILSFVNDSTRKPIIDDLGSSDLTKEDFSRVDSMIQQNIFAAHQLTSPSLFGISEPGKLGTRNEIRDAYEVFKNTYVNDKQRFIEEVFNMLSEYNGGATDLKIKPVEPISYELSEQTLLQIAPKEWLLQKAGIDLPQSQFPTQNPSQNPTQVQQPIVPNQGMINENVKNLTGRQHQQLLRIIRQYTQGKITREIACTLLKTGLGLSDNDINNLLGVNHTQLEIQFNSYSEDEVIQMFSECGVSKDDYNLLKKKPIRFDEQHFEISDSINKKILEVIKKDPKIPNEDIAKAVKIKPSEVVDRINVMVEDGAISINENTQERKLTAPMSKLIDEPLKTKIEVLYSYEWKPEVPTSQRDSAAHPSRPFCKKLMSVDRYWTRKEIETISARLGYSVFDRGGGWWGDSPSCRHYWFSNVLIKKK